MQGCATCQSFTQSGHDALTLTDADRIHPMAMVQRFWVRSNGMAAYGNEDRRINLFDFACMLQSRGDIQDMQA